MSTALGKRRHHDQLAVAARHLETVEPELLYSCLVEEGNFLIRVGRVASFLRRRRPNAVVLVDPVLLYLCATDLPKCATVLRCVLWVFFAAGLARLLSITTHGIPPPLVLVLLATEIVLPPMLHLWLSRALRAG